MNSRTGRPNNCERGIEIVAEPQLSIVAFRYRPPTVSNPERLNGINREFLDRVNAGRRFFLSPTMLDGQFVIRICILCFRTHLDRVRECVETIKQTAEEFEERG